MTLPNGRDPGLLLPDSSMCPLIVVGQDGRIALMNRAAVKLFGRSTYAGPERRVEAVSEAPIVWIADELEAFGAGPSDGLTLERELRTADGARVFQISFSRLVSADGEAGGVALLFADVSAEPRVHPETTESFPEMKRLTLVDEITELCNRRGFFTLSEHMLRLADQLKTHLAFVVCTVDRMDQIDKILGHDEGDRVLVAVAEILRESFRASDIIARVGRGEFAVLAAGAFDGGVDRLADRLKSSVAAKNADGEFPHRLHIEVGLIPYDPQYPRSADEFLSRIPGSV